MLKKICIYVAILLLVTLAGCGGKYTAWALGDNESFTMRGGYLIPDVNTEIGGETCWLQGDETPQVFGVYGLYYLPMEVVLPNPFKADILPENWIMKTYVGGHVGSNINTHGKFVSLITGLKFKDIPIAIEYQNYGAWQKQETVDGEQRILICLRFEF